MLLINLKVLFGFQGNVAHLRLLLFLDTVNVGAGLLSKVRCHPECKKSLLTPQNCQLSHCTCAGVVTLRCA